MKVAISFWEKRISPVFDVSDHFVLLEVEDGIISSRKPVELINQTLFERAKEVSNLGIDVLICGAISRELKNALSRLGVQVNGFVCGNLDDVISAFLNEALHEPRFRMPGAVDQDLSKKTIDKG